MIFDEIKYKRLLFQTYQELHDVQICHKFSYIKICNKELNNIKLIKNQVLVVLTLFSSFNFALVHPFHGCVVYAAESVQFRNQCSLNERKSLNGVSVSVQT